MTTQAPMSAGPRPDPLQALLLFHRSIRAALQAFDELAVEAAEGRCDALKARALHDFFTGPMHWHDVDERESLLERLAARDAPSFGGALEAAVAEHDAVEAIVVDVLDHLHAIAHKRASADPRRLRDAAARLRASLAPHIEREERDVFPRARQLLSERDLEEMASEIADRRVHRRARVPTP